MEFAPRGEVYTCCPGWVKTSIGNIRDNTIEEIWNSDKARALRRKIYSGDVESVCHRICPNLMAAKHQGTLIVSDDLNRFDYITPELANEIREGKDFLDSFPTIYNMSNSSVCNLSCIMCVRNNIEDDHVLMQKAMNDVAGHLANARRIKLTGMGDPFARSDTRNFMINTGPFTNITIDLITNALLLPKYWNQIKHHHFSVLVVSVDAATKSTYEKIRIGGKWENLLESLDLIKKNICRFKDVEINMTVMRENYQEIPLFLNMAQGYGFNASFQRIRGDHGTQNIFNPKDQKALSVLREILNREFPQKRNIFIKWGDMFEFIGG